MRYLSRFSSRALSLLGLLLMSVTACGAELALSVADIVSPSFAAQGVRLLLPEDGSADLQIAALKLQQREFRHVRIRCAGFTLSSSQLACRNGRVDGLPGAKLDFDYEFAGQHLKLGLVAPGGESWQVAGQLGGRSWQASMQLRNAQSHRLAVWLPAGMPLPTQGALNGTLRIGGNPSGLNVVEMDMQLAEVAFSDVSGLHAAEKLRGTVKFSASRKASVWHWQGRFAWHAGELFWQPVYLHGGHELNASGSFDGKQLNIGEATLDIPEVGRVQFSADVRQGALQAGSLRGEKLALNKLFGDYARPFFDKGALTESSLYGQADVDAQYRDGELQSLRLNLRDAGISDAARRFALLGVNSEIDWRADSVGAVSIAFAGGALLGAPLGAGQWAVAMNGLEFNVAQAVLPVMDGKLELRDFHLHRKNGVWHWQFAGSLGTISLEQLSQVVGWPLMLGTLSGRIPRVSYEGERISVEGALLFNVFDGTVVATQLRLHDAFGRTPRLSGNLTMRNLDLDLLTRTFSFGNMQGRMDMDVSGLQLQDWQPLQFDARVYSSDGNYPRKISQKAVQNISALGGAGAAAAIQRSYLRFFENFGYERIGLSCVLRNGVCAMGGIDGANSGAYAIIKGGGIPAISVMGYNRAVSWHELLSRLKRVTQGNVKPVVE